MQWKKALSGGNLVQREFMMSQDELEKEVRQCLAEWEQARQEHDELTRQYFASGPLLPGQPIRWPDKILTANAMAQLGQAIEKERAAEQRWYEELERWRPRPT